MTELVPTRILDSGLIDHLLLRADSDEPAFTCQRGDDERTWTWRELAGKVRAVAAELSAHGEPGNRVAITARQDLPYVAAFLGVLYAGMVAVPLFPPDGRSHRARLVGALNDCAVDVWLTANGGSARLREFADTDRVPRPGVIIDVDDLPSNAGHHPVPREPDDPAYLQYTSGSTGDPAGAVITHRSVTAAIWQATEAFGLDETASCVGWIPFFHDMGLIQLIGLPVCCGARSVFMEPREFIRKPIGWLRQLSDHPNAFTSAPNFAYDLAVEATTGAERAELDLSRVRVTLNGSEPVRPDTVRKFAETFAAQGFRSSMHRPAYGLAEATVFVSGARSTGPTITAFDAGELADGRAVPAADGRELVSAGRPLGQLVRIVVDGKALPDGMIGEIWVHGPHIADGYWRQPERTARTFDAVLPGATPATGWLRTGDLGVIVDEELYITGRLKDLIIVDGRNHYPQDVESTVAAAFSGLRRDRIAAFGRAGGVTVVAERDRDATVDHEAAVVAVRRAVAAEHDLPLSGFRVLEPGILPRTSSGKVARSAARERFYGEGAN